MGKSENKTAYGSDESRWAAVRQRDAGADEVFWYSVRSTGVYCRPSCGARPALRENVAFHASRDEAEAAGFRPCMRCKPEQPPLAERQAAIVAQACRLIDAADEAPDLDTLAAAVGVSRFYFHRMFKAVTGKIPLLFPQLLQARLTVVMAEIFLISMRLWGACLVVTGKISSLYLQMVR